MRQRSFTVRMRWRSENWRQYRLLKLKRLFQRSDLKIFTDPDAFKEFLFGQDLSAKNLLLMSSGNYGLGF